MKNLAGVPMCDIDIAEELKTAGITLVDVPLSRGEVPYRIEGRFANFTFWRAWYYWVVKGLVPLHVAQELYADPVGKKDVRVDGHCGCPPPEKPWIHFRDASGVLLVPQDQYDEFVRVFKDEVPEIMKRQNFRFSDDPGKEGKPYVECYHIDSQEGLNLFIATLKKHGYTA